MHTASQRLLDIWVFPFHSALDDGFLKVFVSYGVVEELQFSSENFLEEHPICSQLLKHPMVGTLVLPRDSQQPSKGPHLKGIDLIRHFLGDGP